MKPIRATLQAVTMNAGGRPVSGIIGVSSEPMTATMEFAGAHGPIRIEVPATAVSGLTDVLPDPSSMSEVRYEVTIRRLRKAPRRKRENR